MDWTWDMSVSKWRSLKRLAVYLEFHYKTYKVNLKVIINKKIIKMLNTLSRAGKWYELKSLKLN